MLYQLHISTELIKLN